MAENKLTWIDKLLTACRNDYASLPAMPLFEIAAPEVFMLRLSDGIALCTVCRKPLGDGPFPTIVMRSCYPEQDPVMDLHAESYCRRGFAFVYQHCRGTGKSEGRWVPNIHDRQDGKETLDWLAARDWVDCIGYWGSSYLAFTGWIIADIVPDEVKTLYLTHYGTDRYTSAYQSGLFRQDVLTSWTMGNAGRPIPADYQESLKFRPHLAVDEQLWGGRIDWYRDWITNTSRNDAYWANGFWKDLEDIPAKIKVPICLGEGWYDHHLGSALRTWEALAPESRQHSLLRIGAWNHGFRPCVQGTVTDHLEKSDVLSAFAWFDKLLRRKELPESSVRTYQIGADRWQDSPGYPFSPGKSSTFFLAGAEPGQPGRLTAEPEISTSLTSYTYDPDNPVPSHGAESLLATMRENGSLVQPPAGWRNDVVSFVSDPLPDMTDILGRIKVILHVASTADDTAFTAKVMEIRADGQAYNIRSGITTLAFRLGSDLPRSEYLPGAAVEAIIELWDINWRLSAGSRLRLDISSSDFPQYSVHTNYAGIWSLQDKARTAEQTILSGREYPSRIILPVQ